MAELLLTDRATCIPVPDELDSVAAAAIGVVGTSADLSLRRAGIQAGESVLVLGATGPLGTAFVQLARLAGAKRVIAAGRNPGRLAQVPAADGVAVLGEEPLSEQLASLGGPGGHGGGSGVGPLGRAGAGLPEARRALPERRRSGGRRDGIPCRVAPRRAADTHRLQRNTRKAGRHHRQLPARRSPRRGWLTRCCRRPPIR